MSRPILSPCLFNLYAEYIMRNARLDEAQAGIKTAGRNINNLKYADTTTLTAESEEELNSLLIWLPDAKSCLTGKNPDAGKDRGRRRKGHRGQDG